MNTTTDEYVSTANYTKPFVAPSKEQAAKEQAEFNAAHDDYLDALAGEYDAD